MNDPYWVTLLNGARVVILFDTLYKCKAKYEN